jgi:hypothetical protein
MLQRVSVYINHHEGAHRLCFAKVTVLISVVHVVNEVSVLCLHILFNPGVRVHRTTEINFVTLAKHSL